LKPRTLIAWDPRTRRRLAIPFAAGWDEDLAPELISVYIGNLVVTVGRAWLSRYGVSLPMQRMDWEVLIGSSR